jgi:outer membrane protein assembly factor BamB
MRWALILIVLIQAHAVSAGEPEALWPQLLGPERNGIVRSQGLNLDWSKRPPKVLWKVPLGSAFSSFAVMGDNVYTLANRGARDGVVCLDLADGKERWFVEAAPRYLDQQKHGPGPRSTPTYAHGKLYCLFGRGELVCLSASGKRLWQADIFKDTGAINRDGTTKYFWGVSMSPLVEGDLVIVQPGGEQGNAVAAFHKDTGQLVWKSGNDTMGYASPIAINVAGSRQVVVPTGSSILGLEPATGRVLWRYAFGNQFNATAATPVWNRDLLFVSAAYGAGCAALEIMPPDKQSEPWTVREKWKNKTKFQNLMATSMIVDGHIYGCHGDLSAFTLRCLDQMTGAIKWEQRMEGRYSFLALEKHIVCVYERGTATLIEATPAAYAPKGELPMLLGNKTWAAPAFAAGRVLLRDQQHALCLDLRE